MRRASDNGQNRSGPPAFLPVPIDPCRTKTGRRRPNGSPLHDHNSVRHWHYEMVDGSMDHNSNEMTRSPTCLQSSYKLAGARCQAQQNQNVQVNNEPGFYSLENGPSKRNPKLRAVLDWGAGILVLSVVAHLLLLLGRLRTQSADTEKFPKSYP